MRMITPDEVNEIAAAAARANLTAQVVQRVFSEPVTDSRGEDALRVTIVVDPSSIETIEGSALLQTLVQIRRDLENAGEERSATVEYATEAELDDVGT